MLTIGQFAKRCGLSVRALRFYEHKGLLAPPRSRDNGRRYYRAAELERVQRIVGLKALGFSLAEIARLLAGRSAPLPKVLLAQLETLEAQKREAEDAIRALRRAFDLVSKGHDLDIETLTRLIRMTTMTKLNKDMEKVHRRYFSEDQLAHLKAHPYSPEEMEAYQKEWREVLARAKQLLGTDPSAPEAKELAHRADKLIALFVRGRPDVKQSLGRMYGDLDQWKDQAEALFGMDLETFKKVQKFLNDALRA